MYDINTPFSSKELREFCLEKGISKTMKKKSRYGNSGDETVNFQLLADILCCSDRTAYKFCAGDYIFTLPSHQLLLLKTQSVQLEDFSPIAA